MATETQTSPTSHDDSPGSIARRIVTGREFGVTVAVVVIFTFCALFADSFLSANNLLTVAQQIAILGIVATGLTFLITVGEIDLSVGSQYGLLAVVLAWSITEVGVPVGTAAPLVFFLGIAIGIVNGLITLYFKIPSFVVTLAALAILRGAALLISEGLPVQGSENTTFRAIFSGFPLPNLAAQTLWMVGVVVIAALVLTKTKFGYDVYATGGNKAAAANAGINTTRVKITCFAITGGLCALAAIILVAFLGSASPLAGQGFELSVIAAVVIGGASIYGGSGSIVGTVLGAVITGIISNALVLFGVDGNWQQVATGLLIIIAVLINTGVSRRAAR